MTYPTWYETVLLALAAWRIWHLFAFDDVLDRPRRYITRLSPSWKQEGDATGLTYREGLAQFIVCPFCAGAWTAAVVWGSWLVFPTETMWLTIPLVLSAGVVGAQRLLSSE